MSFAFLSRRFHRWGAIAIALPLLCVIATGILLQVKKQLAWVQPPEQRTESPVPAVEWGLILAAAKGIPEGGVTSWEDIERVDVRPGKGIMKVITKNHWELQLAVADGRVLQVEYRRSDLIEQIHDGSFFGNVAKLGIFLPAGIVLFVLWTTGLYLWLLPWLTRRKRTKLAERQS